MEWSEEEIAILEKHRRGDDKTPFTEISKIIFKQLGTSRSAKGCARKAAKLGEKGIPAIPMTRKPAPPYAGGLDKELENLPRGACKFPIEVEEGDVFCKEQVVPGKPYCLKHCRKAYVRFRRD